MKAPSAFSLALLFLATACTDSGTEVPADTPDDRLAADVATVAGDATYEDVGVMHTQFGAFGVPTGDVPRTGGWHGACPYDAESSRFVCPVMAVGGRTMSRSYAFADAAGNAQNAYDATATASANFRSTMSGALSRDGWSATVSHERDMTVSGLSGAETSHTINGTGTSAQMRSRHTDAGERTYSMSSVATYTDVVVPFPRTRGAWPLSGTITRTIVATREGDGATHTRTTTTTFNGTRFATLTVGERTFTLDLATGRPVRRR